MNPARVLLFFLLFARLAGADPSGFYAREMVDVSGGAFQMGSEDGDRDERPVHKVVVKDFALGRTEVTLGWYLRCMADSICEAPSWWFIGYFEQVSSHLTPAERATLPVTGISWRQAQLFCKWLGPGYSLPTEAEWEYAAGAGRNWKYPWGDRAGDRYRHSRPQKFLQPAASSPPNPMGLFDMGGSVWEWVDDCYETAKVGGACENRVTKGGSWSEHLWNLRVANKSFGLEDEGYKGLGFRVAYHAR